LQSQVVLNHLRNACGLHAVCSAAALTIASGAHVSFVISFACFVISLHLQNACCPSDVVALIALGFGVHFAIFFHSANPWASACWLCTHLPCNARAGQPSATLMSTTRCDARPSMHRPCCDMISLRRFCAPEGYRFSPRAGTRRRSRHV
jgi:hypothetical protein